MMKKIIFAFIYFSNLMIPLCSTADEYKVSLIGTETFSGIRWLVKGINDRGQVFGGYEDDEHQRYIAFLSDTKGGFSLIEEKDHTYRGYHLFANNNGLVVGVWNGGPGNNNFIWSKALGVRPLDVFGTHINPFALNDLGQLIGSYYSHSFGYRPFLWDNGVLSDMGVDSEFAKEFEELGYHVMDISLTAINNKGEIAGYFQYGKYNEKKKKNIRAGYKIFFWDGQPHVISLPTDGEQPLVVKVNNRGVVLVRDCMMIRHEDRRVETTYLWDVENGLKVLSDFYGESLNDSSVVLGFKREEICCRNSKEIPAIWRDGICTTVSELLEVPSIDNISPPFSDTYTVERIERCIGINNKNQIVCEGWIWGEIHPCLLEPIKPVR